MRKAINSILIAAAAILILWGITQIGKTELIYDKFFTAIVLLVVVHSWKQVNYRSWTVFVTLGAIILHNVYLYGNSYFGIPFDKIMHVVGAFALTLMIYQILKHQNAKWLVIWTILVVMGIAALHEIVEFLGYSYLGEGDGIFFFGVGDFGEWNNTMWDLISNLIGGGIALLAIHR